MEPLRTITVTVPPLFHDIVTRSLSRFIELQIVGYLDTRLELEQKLIAAAPGLVLIGLAESEDDAVAFSLSTLLSKAIVVRFSSDLRQTLVLRAERSPIVLDDVSLGTLVDAIQTLRA